MKERLHAGGLQDCEKRPATTYDNWPGFWRERLVPLHAGVNGGLLAELPFKE
jgi:hypothetical protein